MNTAIRALKGELLLALLPRTVEEQLEVEPVAKARVQLCGNREPLEETASRAQPPARTRSITDAHVEVIEEAATALAVILPREQRT